MNSIDDRLSRLTELIASWPGLVARPDRRLIEDCLVLVPHLAGARRIVDVGSGGGLPGLALKVALPELDVALLEANRRKAAFLEYASAVLQLEGVEVIPGRAEDVGRDPRFREAFDAAVARALAPMAVLAELCLPLVKVGGVLLAMKTQGAADVEGARAAIDRLGGTVTSVESAPSGLRERGEVVVVTKVEPTPDEFPRRAGVPARRPLGK